MPPRIGPSSPATPYCGVDRTSGHATTIVVPLQPSVAAQVKELARAARVTTAVVWTAAVALMAQERCVGHGEVVCRLTCVNRYTGADVSTVDYRAQPVFLPLSLSMDQPAPQALRQIYRSSLLAHAHGWYDALHVVEQLNRPSRGAWFLPTVELNFLQGTRGSQAVGSTVNPYSFNPSSAKADIVVGVDDRTVSVTLRGAGTTALASGLLERVTEWLRLLARGGARPLAELVRHQDLPDCSLVRGRGVTVNRASMQALFYGALGHGNQYDMELDRAGRIVVHSPRPLSSDDALRLWCRQALVPNSVLPDRWITRGSRGGAPKPRGGLPARSRATARAGFTACLKTLPILRRSSTGRGTFLCVVLGVDGRCWRVREPLRTSLPATWPASIRWWASRRVAASTSPTDPPPNPSWGPSDMPLCQERSGTAPRRRSVSGPG